MSMFSLVLFPTLGLFPFMVVDRIQPQTICFFPNMYFTSLFNLSCTAAKSYIHDLLSPLRVLSVGMYHIATTTEKA